MKNVYLSLTLLLFFALNLSAQRNCGSMEYLDQQIQENPQLIEQMQAIEDFTERFASESGARNVITIPVVVHVVYNTSSENISDAQVLTQIDVLNDDFRRLNSDADNTWSQAADTEIEFCMATIDPDGNATNGITRTATSKRSFRTNDDIKKSNKGGKDPWPAGDYLNIWVGDISNGILGYAQFPGGNPATDGVVVDYLYFGTIGTATAPFDLGRTGTHEVGHWLNLRHIWGDGGCSVDDFVGDTPLSDGPNYGCAEGHVSCGTTDMVQNYMDYSDDACMNLFTEGQKSRMLALFASGGARESLLSSGGCGGTPPPPPPATCDDGIQNGDETGVDCGGPDCPACPPAGVCEAPTNLSYSSAKGGRSADLSWSDVSAANDYTLELREVGTSWQSFAVSGNSVRINGLTRNASYEWRVTANCSDGSETSTIASFVAGQSRLGEEVTLLTVYPNPAKNRIYLNADNLFDATLNYNTLTVTETPEQFQALILDVNGRLMRNAMVQDNGADIELDIAGFAPGLYLVQLRTQSGEVLGATKFIVE
mgnify:CR=1 FL=1